MIEDDPTFTLTLTDTRQANNGRDRVRRAYQNYVARTGQKAKPMRADYDHAIRHHKVWCLNEADALVAVLERISEDDHLLVENIAIEPARQGEGIGKRLMASGEREAKRQAFNDIRLDRNEKFVENIARYSSIGYDVMHRETRGDRTIVHMSKTLPTSNPE